MCLAAGGSVEGEILIYWYIYYVLLDSGQHIILGVVWCNCKYLLWSSSHYDEAGVSTEQGYIKARCIVCSGLSYHINSYFPNNEPLVTSILLTLTHAVSPGPGSRARQQQHRHAAWKQKGKGWPSRSTSSVTFSGVINCCHFFQNVLEVRGNNATIFFLMKLTNWDKTNNLWKVGKICNFE